MSAYVGSSKNLKDLKDYVAISEVPRDPPFSSSSKLQHGAVSGGGSLWRDTIRVGRGKSVEVYIDIKGVQGYLAHKKQQPPLGLPNGPRQMLL